jgi:formate hydrogenlyase subunit 6/NADH:ubiquinone oxidoreductase subunit I
MRRPGKMLAEVLRSALRKPATVLYPFVKFRMPALFRGRLRFYPEKCIGCKLCMRDCPAGAIQIIKIGDKQFRCEIDLARCIYCAQCVDSCPRKALEATEEYELAQLHKQALIMSRGPDEVKSTAEPSSKTAQAAPEPPPAEASSKR